jgi:hypothetical protein
MFETSSSLERDRDIARDREPEEMDRLETLRAGFDTAFKAALEYARVGKHLVPWHDGTFILAFQPGVSPVGLRLRIDEDKEQIIDVGMVGKLDCPSFVEVVYDRQESAPSQSSPSRWPRHDCQGEGPVASTLCEPYWGVGDYGGVPPTPPAGAVPITGRRLSIEEWWEQSTAHPWSRPWWERKKAQPSRIPLASAQAQV